jgi:hypothetical protein
MPSTLVTPGPEEPRAGRFTATAHRDLDDQAVLDFLRGEYTGRPQPTLLPPLSRQPSSPQSYMPAAVTCFAIVQYDPTAGVIVRRVIGLFGDVDSAESFARDDRRHLYDIVPATAVIATPVHGTP